MTYQSDDYHRLARNCTRLHTMRSLIDLARKLNQMKFVDRIVMSGDMRGETISVDIAAAAKNEMLNAAIASLVASAKSIQDEEFEPVDLMKSIGV